MIPVRSIAKEVARRFRTHRELTRIAPDLVSSALSGFEPKLWNMCLVCWMVSTVFVDHNVSIYQLLGGLLRRRPGRLWSPERNRCLSCRKLAVLFLSTNTACHLLVFVLVSAAIDDKSGFRFKWLWL